MAIPKIKEQDIIAALKYIDENGVPFHNQSTKYELVTDDGKKYPPKYVKMSSDRCLSLDKRGEVEELVKTAQGYIMQAHSARVWK